MNEVMYRCSGCGKTGHNLRTCPFDAAERERRNTEIAALCEMRDAIHADIVEHEKVRATVEERIVEGYQRRAELEVEIRKLRARQA